jgi:hypothetical protein
VKTIPNPSQRAALTITSTGENAPFTHSPKTVPIVIPVTSERLRPIPLFIRHFIFSLISIHPGRQKTNFDSLSAEVNFPLFLIFKELSFFQPTKMG